MIRLILLLTFTTISFSQVTLYTPNGKSFQTYNADWQYQNRVSRVRIGIIGLKVLIVDALEKFFLGHDRDSEFKCLIILAPRIFS